MKESIAFWYEPLSASAKEPPDLELHFNLWRDLLVRDTNFFDVGIKFLKSDDRVIAKTVKSFSLFIPGKFEKTQCIDLSPIMHESQTLNAVFNDVVTIAADRANEFELKIGPGERLIFYEIDIENEIVIDFIQMDGNATGTIFTFLPSLCQRMNQNQDTNHYFRLRFKLDKATRELFFSDSRPSEWYLLPSFVRTELTEFRWNERRTFPSAISERPQLRYFRTAAIHYFLVRDVQFELVSAHTNFRKIRRLEDHLWKHYLHGVPPNGNPDWRVQHAIARGMAREMVIYHWRARRAPGEQTIDDFIAFAKFRVPIPNLLIYAVVIGCLGGAGNALYALAMTGAASFRAFWAPSLKGEALTWPENLVIAAGFMLLAWIGAQMAAILTPLLRWLYEKILGAWYFIKPRLGLFFSRLLHSR